MKWVVLSMCCLLGFVLRIVSALKFEESVVEFDPFFNVRCAKYIDENGLMSVLEWFDEKSWYPFGRMIGETSYPGMMVIAVIAKRILKLLHINIDLLKICVYFGPCWSIVSCLFCYRLGKLLLNENVGLICAWMNATSAGMILITSAGKFDYESMCISLIMIVIYYFLLSLQTDSHVPVLISVCAYGILCASWGGAVILRGLLPIYAICLCITGHFTFRLYFAYSIWFVFGILFESTIPCVSVVTTPERLLGLFAFLLLPIWPFVKSKSKTFFCVLLSVSFVLLVFKPSLLPSGRLLSVINPFTRQKEKGFVMMVDEHTPASWISFYFVFGPLLYLFPLGYVKLCNLKGYIKLFFMIYCVFGLYFGSTMSRLLSVAAPGLILTIGVALDSLISRIRVKPISCGSILGFAFVFGFAILSVNHGVYFAFNDCASTFIQFQIEGTQGITYSDDHREMWRWIRTNTPVNSKILVLWDEGYRMSYFTDRTTYSDGNTNNFTHISLSGLVTLSSELEAWKLARMLDVDYYFVLFGGCSGYADDDVSKMGSIIDITAQKFDNVSVDQYLDPDFPLFVGGNMTQPATTESLLFKASYHNFDRFRLNRHIPPNADISRSVIVHSTDFQLSAFEETYTTKHWICRLYHVGGDPIWDDQ